MPEEKTWGEFDAPKSLADRVDTVAEVLDIPRTRLLIDALENNLDELATEEPVRRRLSNAYYDGRTDYDTLDASGLWRLANRWGCVEKWADLFAYIDQREVHHDELFLPWEEFIDLANDYGVYPRGQHPEDSLRRGLEELGDHLETPVDVYLLGGGNLLLRGLKDLTKDADIVVEDGQTFLAVAESLQDLGHEERSDLEAAYNQLDPSIVLEKEGFPRWDIFVEAIAGQLQLTPAMIERCDQSFKYGNLHVHLLSLTDIFVFKSITEREGDLEDAALIARQADLDWESRSRPRKIALANSSRLLCSIRLMSSMSGTILSPQLRTGSPRTVSRTRYSSRLTPRKQSKTSEKSWISRPPDLQQLRKLEEEGQITVDRSGRLNTYQRAESTDR